MIGKQTSVVCTAEGGVLRAKILGEVDHHGAKDLRDAIDDAILAERPKKVVLDLSAVDFMDSSGLGLIMGRFALVRRYGGKLAVADPSAAVLKMMQLAGMEKMIPIKYTKKGRC